MRNPPWLDGVDDLDVAMEARVLHSYIRYADNEGPANVSAMKRVCALLAFEKAHTPAPVKAAIDLCRSVGKMADGRDGYTCHNDAGHAGPHRCGPYEWSDEAPTMVVATARILREAGSEVVAGLSLGGSCDPEEICKLFSVSPEDVGLRITEVPAR